MPKIVIRHLSGTKANQIEELPLQGFSGVLIGRESNAQVRFDADRDDLVSREHARIDRVPNDPSNGFLITDLKSRNGTFIKGQRLHYTSPLQHGDRVQLGPGGPEFEFELDPPPSARATRLAPDPISAGPTRASSSLDRTSTDMNSWPSNATSQHQNRSASRETVMRWINDLRLNVKDESRKTMWTVVIGMLVVLLAIGGYFMWSRQQQAKMSAEWRLSEQQAHDAEARIEKLSQMMTVARTRQSPAVNNRLKDELDKANADYAAAQKRINDMQESGFKPPAAPGEPQTNPLTGQPTQPQEMTPEQVHAANVNSVILVEATWKITDTGTGGQIYLYHHPNELGACPDAPKSEHLPMFTEDGGKLMPVLSTLPDGNNNTPIVGSLSGSGFIVSGDGFFLTNRHVLAPWKAVTNVASFTKKTMGLKWKHHSIVGCLSASEFPGEWVPSDGSPMVIEKMEDKPTGTVAYTSGRMEATPGKTSVQGEAVYNVTMAKTMQRYNAKLSTLSERTDVALGKVDLPGSLRPVTMFPDSDAIKPGQSVTVMGYPAISPRTLGWEVSRDMFSTHAHEAPIADPTLTTGPISKVMPSGNAVKGVDGFISNGEVYQLGINTTGAGNSGGPVFDSKGRVIAIFYAEAWYGRTTVTFAIPIKFGQALIQNPALMK